MLFIIIHGQALWRSVFMLHTAIFCLSSVPLFSLIIFIHQSTVFSEIFFFFTGVESLVFEPLSCLSVMHLAFRSTTLLSVKWEQHIASQHTFLSIPVGFRGLETLVISWVFMRGGISGSTLLEGSLGSVWTPRSSSLTRLQLTTLTSHSEAIATQLLTHCFLTFFACWFLYSWLSIFHLPS